MMLKFDQLYSNKSPEIHRDVAPSDYLKPFLYCEDITVKCDLFSQLPIII